MAIFGFGKKLGLGSTDQVISGLSQIGAGLTGASGILSGLSTAFGGQPTNGTQQGQSVAISQATQTQPQETQASSQQAGFGALLAPATGALRTYGTQAGRFLLSPQGQLATGLGLAAGGAAISFMDPMTGQPKRLTRKMQAQVKQMVEIIGIEGAAMALGLTQMEIAQILAYKFRRRSSGITGAQLRTAQRVNNKIIHMHDKLKASYGSATRRTTTRRAASTRVTQIKN
jgi:hypothetical protein